MKYESSSIDFNFRIWVHPEEGDCPDIEVWYQGLEPVNYDMRFSSDWAKESISNEDFYDIFDLDKDKHWQIVGEATLTGSYDYYSEYDEELVINNYEKIEVPEEWLNKSNSKIPLLEFSYTKSDKEIIEDLKTFINRLIVRVDKYDKSCQIVTQAIEYLRDNGLTSSILRELEPNIESESVVYYDRQKATELISPFISNIEGHKGVSYEKCIELLGEERFMVLKNDNLRNKGPAEEYIYPWNVIDYLIFEHLSKDNINRRIYEGKTADDYK